MDPIPLVASEIEDGQKLITRLVQAGFPVKAAAWVKKTDGGFWYLYLVSPVRDRQGPLKTYRRVNSVVGELRFDPSRGEPLEIKVVGAASPVGKAIVAQRDRYPNRLPRWVRENRLGDLEIDAAYLYPPVSAPRSSDSASGVA